jgi:hypothetical protein
MIVFPHRKELIVQDPYYDTDPYEAIFSKMDVIGNQVSGQHGNNDPFRLLPAMEQPRRKGASCPRCGRAGSSSKTSYCVYG